MLVGTENAQVGRAGVQVQLQLVVAHLHRHQELDVVGRGPHRHARLAVAANQRRPLPLQLQPRGRPGHARRHFQAVLEVRALDHRRAVPGPAGGDVDGDLPQAEGPPPGKGRREAGFGGGRSKLPARGRQGRHSVEGVHVRRPSVFFLDGPRRVGTQKHQRSEWFVDCGSSPN
jgi:hypothetical protein